MGLIHEGGPVRHTLTDILGAEDAFGDMDFKGGRHPERDHCAPARHQARRPSRASVLAAVADPGQGQPGWTILDVMREAIDVPGRGDEP